MAAASYLVAVATGGQPDSDAVRGACNAEPEERCVRYLAASVTLGHQGSSRNEIPLVGKGRHRRGQVTSPGAKRGNRLQRNSSVYGAWDKGERVNARPWDVGVDLCLLPGAWYPMPR
jgi:hypothetical protein